MVFSGLYTDLVKILKPVQPFGKLISQPPTVRYGLASHLSLMVICILVSGKGGRGIT